MLSKAIGTLSYADIEALVTNSVCEGRTLDFKRNLIGRTDEDKREFLADFSSFANTAGGDLIFGVEEDQGIAVAIPALELADPDAEILRLESIIRSGLEPRLPRFESRWIPGPNGRGVVVMRTARSWAAPHRVIFRDAKFYGRSSAGKYPLDVAELRTAFVNAEGIVQSIRRFRQERVATIEADQGPVLLHQGPKVVFHVIPLSAFVDSPQITFDTRHDVIRPLGFSTGGFATRHTLEGLVSYTGREDIVDGVYAYTLLFRSGIIEAAGAMIGGSDSHGRFVAPEAVEWPLLRDFKVYNEFLAKRSIDPPYYIFLSLIGVREHRLYMRRNIFSPTLTQRQDVILIPELTVDDSNQTVERILRPLFDLFWNAFGLPRSASFDENGKYIGERI
jgi:hypothetical protein